MPNLHFGRKLVALPYSAGADVVNLRTIAVRTGINMGAAIGAKSLGATVSAVTDLDIDLRFAGSEFDAVFAAGHDHTEGRPTHGLTIGAMTDARTIWIDFGLIGDFAAMAGAVDFHGIASIDFNSLPPA